MDVNNVGEKLKQATRNVRDVKIKADVDTKRVRKQVKESVEREQPEVKPKLTMREQLQRMKDAFKYHFEIPNVHVESAKTVHQLHDEIVNGTCEV